MKKIIIFFALFGSHCFSQQKSDISLDSSNHDTIFVHQQGKSQESNIKLRKSNQNNLKVIESQKDSASVSMPQKSIFSYISHTNNLFIMLISIATFIGLVWKGIQVVKKR